MNPGELSYKEEEEISDLENNVNLISNKYVWVGDDTEDINLLEELSMEEKEESVNGKNQLNKAHLPVEMCLLSGSAPEYFDPRDYKNPVCLERKWMGQDCLCYSEKGSDLKLTLSKFGATKTCETSKQKALSEFESSTSDEEWLRKENVFLKVSRIQKNSAKHQVTRKRIEDKKNLKKKQRVTTKRRRIRKKGIFLDPFQQALFLKRTGQNW